MKKQLHTPTNPYYTMNNTYMFYLQIIIIYVFFVNITCLGAQTGPPALPTAAPPAETGLFDSDAPLHITLSGSIRTLLGDRVGSPKKYACSLSCAGKDSLTSVIPVEVSTRGHFRRLTGNCAYPPLLIRFPKDSAHRNTVFGEQQKIKLVMPCTDDAYIVREWLVYKLYNLVTPLSFRARLAQVTLIDDKNKKERGPFYGILIEEEAQMAKRNGMIAIERKMKPRQTQIDAFLSMAVFQYLIGNTDWSVQFQQNIKLMAADSAATPVAVPYDFDHSGMVDAPYAGPPVELQMQSVKQRRYRGYCVADMKMFEPIIEQYKHLKNDIYGVYTGCALLDPKYVKSMVKYLDDFYETIESPKAWQKEFFYPCDPKGTGNVVIKGLKD